MGLFNRKRNEKIEKAVEEYFQMMTAYAPVFSSFEGSLYEMELTRAAINSFATHVSKLKPEINGSKAGNRVLERTMQFKPNALMDTTKYLERLATVYMVENTAFIAPLFDNRGEIVGFYPILPSKSQIVSVDGQKFLRYNFENNIYGAIELDLAGRLTQMQYRDELYGESNRPMRPTMELINTQNQGIVEGVKSSASIRFMAKLANVLKSKDLEAERERFRETNLSSKNNGGVLMFDQKYEEVKQLQSSPYIVDPEQMKLIRENVYDYFGTNEHILRNDYNSDQWNAYYEGKIEPFAIQMSLVHTNMIFSDREIANGNQVIFTANRLQYLSNDEKLSTVTQLFDRGFITHNQGLEVFNMSPVENGDKRYIRREYAIADNYDGEINDGEND